MNTSSDTPSRLKKLRAAAGLSQDKFAKKLFLSRGLYNGLETGRETPSPWVIQQIDILERAGVGLLNTNILPAQQEPGAFGDALELLREELENDLARVIEAAGVDRDRLGWIKEQMRLYLLRPAEAWHDQRIQSDGHRQLGPLHEKIEREVLADQRRKEREEAKRRQSSEAKTQGGAGR